MQYKSYKNTTQIIQNYITKTHKGWCIHNFQYSTVPLACLRTDHIIHRPFGKVTEQWRLVNRGHRPTKLAGKKYRHNKHKLPNKI